MMGATHLSCSCSSCSCSMIDQNGEGYSSQVALVTLRRPLGLHLNKSSKVVKLVEEHTG